VHIVSQTRLDVLAIGNAIVDVIAAADEAFLEAEGLAKGSMRLIDSEEGRRLYERMAPGRETSGGSAANTVAGIAALGLRSGFIGQVAADQLGEVFTHDIRALGVEFATPPIADGVPTARCLILVTPDAQRTMNTFLGASQNLSQASLDEDQIRSASILYLEGYLWDPEGPRAAMSRAIEIAHAAGRKVAFTLSDSFCVDRHRSGFLELIERGDIDILFANEHEIQSLAQSQDLESAIAAIAPRLPLLVVTCSEKGAIAVEGATRASVPAEPIEQIVDTTGAGDLFRAGMLYGFDKGWQVARCLQFAAAAGALKCRGLGGTGYVPPVAEIEALIAEYPEVSSRYQSA
jgi:sugar/nucleoside kinase (ribokinase family)